MPAYLVQLPDTARGQRKVDAAVVFAETVQEAKDVCKSRFSEDAPAAWQAATVTELASKPQNTSPNFDGWKLRVAILNSDPVIDITVIGDATDDTLDEVAALMVIALNATSLIANAAYAAPTLTISSIGDALGDRTTLIEFIPPTAGYPGQDPIPDLVASKTHEGIAAAVLDVTFQAGTYSLPNVYEEFNNAKV